MLKLIILLNIGRDDDSCTPVGDQICNIGGVFLRVIVCQASCHSYSLFFPVELSLTVLAQLQLMRLVSVSWFFLLFLHYTFIL